jgi:hypothetical protein
MCGFFGTLFLSSKVNVANRAIPVEAVRVLAVVRIELRS